MTTAMMVSHQELAQVNETTQENEQSKFSKMKHASVPNLEQAAHINGESSTPDGEVNPHSRMQVFRKTPVAGHHASPQQVNEVALKTNQVVQKPSANF